MPKKKDQPTAGVETAKSVNSNADQHNGDQPFELGIDVAEDTCPHAPIPESLLARTDQAVAGDFSENSREDTAVETKPLQDSDTEADDLAMLQQTEPVTTGAQRTTAYSDPNAMREEIARQRASLEQGQGTPDNDEQAKSEPTVSMTSGWLDPAKHSSKRRITGRTHRASTDEKPWKDKVLAPPVAKRRRPSKPMSKVKIWENFNPTDAVVLGEGEGESVGEKIERSSLQPGDAIGDGYEIIQSVGSGNLGTVYKARSKDGTGLVAIKMVHPDIAILSGVHGRIQRLAQSTMSVQSPVIHRIIDIGNHGGCPFVVTEWLEGRALSAVLDSRGQLDSTITGRVVTLVLEALEMAHSNELFHGDLQARHIFVLSDPHADPFIKVVDFGLSNLLPRQNSTVADRPWGLAPERIEGKSPDARTDLYGVGYLIFQMLSGTTPFETTKTSAAEHQRDLERQHHAQSAPSLSDYTTEPLRPGLVQVVEMLLARSPEQRPASVQVLRTLLQRAASNQPLDIEASNSTANQPQGQSTVAYSEHSREEALAAIARARSEQETSASDGSTSD
jgi:serine/threonine protein kinase